MLQHEFEALTGMSVEDTEFNQVINPMYMSTDLDKQVFCKEWKKHNLGNSEVAKAMSKRVNEQRMAIDGLKKQLDSVVRFLLSRGEPACDKQAIKIAGHKECISIKMQQNYELSEDDRAFIIEMCR